MTKRRRLGWRCATREQERLKAEVYNSREWRELRHAKMEQEGWTCQMCREEGEAQGIRGGFIRPATCVHHIIPIETANSREEMWRLAIGCGLEGLLALCDQHHAQIHRDARSHTREAVSQRKADRLERFKNRFPPPAVDDATH